MEDASPTSTTGDIRPDLDTDHDAEMKSDSDSDSDSDHMEIDVGVRSAKTPFPLSPDETLTVSSKSRSRRDQESASPGLDGDVEMAANEEGDETAREMRENGLTFVRDWLRAAIHPYPPGACSSASTSCVPLVIAYKAYTSIPFPPSTPVCNIDAFLNCVVGEERLNVEGPSGSGHSGSLEQGEADGSSLRGRKTTTEAEGSGESDAASRTPSNRSYPHLITASTLHDLTFAELSDLWARAEADLLQWSRDLLDVKARAKVGASEKADKKQETGYKAVGLDGTSASPPKRINQIVIPFDPKDAGVPRGSAIKSQTRAANGSKGNGERDTDKDLQDELFTVSKEHDLPCPEASFRRVFERNEAESDGSGMGRGQKGGQGPFMGIKAVLQTRMADAEANGQKAKREKGTRRMAFCRQIVGTEGARLVAQQWLNISIQRPVKPNASATKSDPISLSDIYTAYEKYPNHPPRMPKVAKEQLLQLVLGMYPVAARSNPSLPARRDKADTDGLHDGDMDKITFRGIRFLPSSSLGSRETTDIWRSIGFNFRSFQGKKLRAEAKQQARAEAQERDDQERVLIRAQKEAQKAERRAEMDGWFAERRECRMKGAEMVIANGVEGGMGKDPEEAARLDRKRKWLDQVLEQDRRRADLTRCGPHSASNGAARILPEPGNSFSMANNQDVNSQSRAVASRHSNSSSSNNRPDGLVAGSTGLPLDAPIWQAKRMMAPPPPPDLHTMTQNGLVYRPEHRSHNSVHPDHTPGGMSYPSDRQAPSTGGHTRPMDRQMYPSPVGRFEAASSSSRSAQPFSQPLRHSAAPVYLSHSGQAAGYQLNQALNQGYRSYPNPYQRAEPHQSPPLPSHHRAQPSQLQHAPPRLPQPSSQGQYPQHFEQNGPGAVLLPRQMRAGQGPVTSRTDERVGHDAIGGSDMSILHWLDGNYHFSASRWITQRDLWLTFVRHIQSLPPDLARRYSDVQPQALFQIAMGKFGCRVVKRASSGAGSGGDYVIEGMGVK